MCNTTKYKVTPQRIYGLLKQELNLRADLRYIRNRSLYEYGITMPEVNWLLNTIEYQFGVAIDEGDISLRVTMQELWQLILKALSRQD